MQLLITQTAPDFAKWKSAFDTDAEARRNAGLTQLQLWREPDTNRIWALFEVNDPDKARAFLDNGAFQLSVTKADTSASQHHFLETA